MAGRRKSRPTAEVVNFRAYQVEANDLLLSEVLNTNSLGLFGPTGCGKTLVIQTLLAQMVRMPEFKSALIATPQIQIRDGFSTGGRSVVFPFIEHDAPAIQRARIVEVPHIYDLTGRKYDADFRGLFRGKSRLIRTVCFQTLIRRAGMSPGTTCLLPKSLRGHILVVDEAHWLNPVESSKLDKVVTLWRKRGGLVIHSTATPFDLPLPEDAQFYCRTLAEHILGGIYAPGDVRIDFHQVKSLTAHKLSQLRGETMSDSDLDAICQELVTTREKKGLPKTVMNLPAGGSERFAKALEAALAAKGVRVLNAVSSSPKVRDRLLNALKGERTLQTYKESQYDVILSCMRFNEGTDWPFCSLFINVGLPSDFGLIIQRLGRTLRYKGDIQGYPARWRNQAEMLFVIPSAGHKLWEEFYQHGKDHVFMLAGLMADLQVSDYLTELRKRLGDKGRTRKGRGPEYYAKLEKLASMIGLTQEKTREAYASLQEAVLVLRKERGVRKLSANDVTWADFEPVLKRLGSYSQEELDQRKEALLVRHSKLKGDKELMPFLASLDAATTRKLGGGKGSTNRIIKRSLQDAFDEATCDFQGLIDAAVKSERVVGRITGETSKQVGERLVGRLRVPTFTKEQALEALKSYCMAEGKSPPPDEDASPWFGFPAGTFPWSSVPDDLFR